CRTPRREVWNESTLPQMITKVTAQICTSTVWSQKFSWLAYMILYFILELLELFKGFRLVPH
ncbi:hypothetical protein ACU6QO_00270, partial [Aeromonas veronii]|uniref:hypothetical protein n=1 Tax=Aeromonas veronii TaxID=654 RepID=UPI00406CDAB7